mmetsp:Transcript_110991/g.264817  ORF Transcript_110991/g.264817 Transcript_110991/m.264817 type:complete len:235 (-) Transcript_110991:867-1571(-)
MKLPVGLAGVLHPIALTWAPRLCDPLCRRLVLPTQKARLVLEVNDLAVFIVYQVHVFGWVDAKPHDASELGGLRRHHVTALQRLNVSGWAPGLVCNRGGILPVAVALLVDLGALHVEGGVHRWKLQRQPRLQGLSLAWPRRLPLLRGAVVLEGGHLKSLQEVPEVPLEQGEGDVDQRQHEDAVVIAVHRPEPVVAVDGDGIQLAQLQGAVRHLEVAWQSASCDAAECLPHSLLL